MQPTIKRGTVEEIGGQYRHSLGETKMALISGESSKCRCPGPAKSKRKRSPWSSNRAKSVFRMEDEGAGG